MIYAGDAAGAVKSGVVSAGETVGGAASETFAPTAFIFFQFCFSPLFLKTVKYFRWSMGCCEEWCRYCRRYSQ